MTTIKLTAQSGREMIADHSELQREMQENEEAIDRFEEIKDEMKELLQEALQLVVDQAGRDSLTYERARRYWCAGITVNLDKEHSWLAGSMCTMQDTINELKIDGCGNCGGLVEDDEYELCSDCR